MAKIRLAPFALAPWRMDSPTQPIPKTATFEPSAEAQFTLDKDEEGDIPIPGVLVAAPYPVVIPVMSARIIRHR
jgi:hypothetical protein